MEKMLLDANRRAVALFTSTVAIREHALVDADGALDLPDDAVWLLDEVIAITNECDATERAMLAGALTGMFVALCDTFGVAESGYAAIDAFAAVHRARIERGDRHAAHALLMVAQSSYALFGESGIPPHPLEGPARVLVRDGDDEDIDENTLYLLVDAAAHHFVARCRAERLDPVKTVPSLFPPVTDEDMYAMFDEQEGDEW